MGSKRPPTSANWQELAKTLSQPKRAGLKKKTAYDTVAKEEIKRGVLHQGTRPVPSSLLKRLSGYTEEPLPEAMQKVGKYVALDCEMVGIGPPPYKESALARVSIVNFYGHVLLDVYVRPKERVGDFRTAVSGITPAHLKGERAVTFEEAQQRTADILKDKILIGHALHNDEKVLLLSHPRKHIRDTSSYRPFLEQHNGGRSHLSLRKLAKAELDITIQSGAHSSVEDARCVMALYRQVKNAWERNRH